MTKIDISALSASLQSDAYSELPESTGGVAQFYELIKSLDGKWINTATIVDHMRQQGATDKECDGVANRLNLVKKQAGIEVRKVGRKNFYRYVSQ